jgi:hypothetical protein
MKHSQKLRGIRRSAADRRALEFESQMAALAADPGVQGECAAIAGEFSVADLDGLRRACPRKSPTPSA